MGLTIYGPGGHLDHVTWTINIFSLPSQGGSISNLALICQAVLEKKVLKMLVKCMYIATGQGQTPPWGQIFT